MITKYFRPQTLEEALKLLSQPHARPLGGGTILSHPTENPYSVVDLQDLGLDKIRKNGNNLETQMQEFQKAAIAEKDTRERLKSYGGKAGQEVLDLVTSWEKLF